MHVLMTPPLKCRAEGSSRPSASLRLPECWHVQVMAGRRCSREECLLFSLARKELEPMVHAQAGRDGMIMRQCEDIHISEKRER